MKNENIRTAAKPLDRVEQERRIQGPGMVQSKGTGQGRERKLARHCKRFKERYAEVERRTKAEWGLNA